MKKIVQFLILLLLCNIAFSQAGKFDSTFSNNGKVITHFNKPAALHAMALQADGKIIAVGTVDSLFTIVRYNANGSEDKIFDDNIKVKSLNGEANAVAIQDNGKIVVVGITSTRHGYDTYHDILAARYNINGSVDSGFGDYGSVTIDIGDFDYCNAVAIQQDGKIVLAGRTGGDVSIIRLNKNGSYDKNFGNKGKVDAIYEWYTVQSVNTIALQTDGKIIIGGVIEGDGDYDPDYTLLMRFKTNGDIDSSFGYYGRANFSIIINDIAVQSNGKIVCAGNGKHIYWINEFEWDVVDDPALVRYTTDGIIDSTYGSNGYVYPLPPEGDRGAALFSVALLSNDKSVTTLQFFSLDKSDTTLAVLRFNPNGEKDLSFGSNGGKVFTNPYLTFTNPFPYLYNKDRPSTPILVQPDGKIVVGCTHDSSGFYIARLLGSKADNESISEAHATNNTNRQASVYPNPAHDLLSVKGLDATTSYKLTITDMQGRMYSSADVKNTGAFSFNILKLPPATYILTIQNEALTEAINFIKQ